jgi:hypothetical protein
MVGVVRHHRQAAAGQDFAVSVLAAPECVRHVARTWLLLLLLLLCTLWQRRGRIAHHALHRMQHIVRATVHSLCCSRRQDRPVLGVPAWRACRSISPGHAAASARPLGRSMSARASSRNAAWQLVTEEHPTFRQQVVHAPVRAPITHGRRRPLCLLRHAAVQKLSSHWGLLLAVKLAHKAAHSGPHAAASPVNRRASVWWALVHRHPRSDLVGVSLYTAAV